jgi:hypothetical protein
MCLFFVATLPFSFFKYRKLSFSVLWGINIVGMFINPGSMKTITEFSKLDNPSRLRFKTNFPTKLKNKLEIIVDDSKKEPT